MITFDSTTGAVLRSRLPRGPATMVNELTVSCFGLVDVLLYQQTRVHASGAAVYLAILELSRDGKVRHGAVDEAMRGDGVQASRSLNRCKSLTVLLGPDAVATARARSRHNSAGLACA